LMVNHRFVKNQSLNHAITAAYEGLIHADQKPEYFISLEVDPATIDINIHPTKTEIKFEEEHSIYALLKSAVKHSLGQFNIAPTLDFSKDPTFDIPYNYKDKAPEFPRIQVDPNFNPFKEEYESRSSSRSSSNFGNYPKKTASWESLYTGIESAIDTSASETIVSSLFEAEPTKNQGKKIIALAKKYLVTTLGGELIIINCNRAHQRILFEDFMTVPYLYFAAERIFRLPESLLGYRQNATSITANVSHRHLADIFYGLQKAIAAEAQYPNHLAELHILRLKAWRLIVAYSVKQFLRTRDAAYLANVSKFRAPLPPPPEK